MAINHRSRPPMMTGPSDSGGKTMLAATLTLVMLAAIGLREVVSPDALAPAVATALFGLAAALGAIALLLRRRTAMLDLAGMITFVAVFVSLMIESDQMTRLIMLSDQSESN